VRRSPDAAPLFYGVAKSKPGDVAVATTTAAEPTTTTSTASKHWSMLTVAEKACGVEFTDYVGVSVEQTKYTYNWFTSASSSQATSSRAICVLFRADGSPITGSVHA